ncbi:hypothetical protein PHYBLDRAFT_161941 [Phycomyces blakesleeanus NRRL 1555(-)]|uniref:Uncharacterized protein n=1 Tax=Phycomyces blakesleeanus (strain ATCC 8743b / DSM 1359 / FGSC 10004 / NBRC 33097 / NRRL 1555) TaxID=763407 RepID=A0A167RCA0_PHYB8|nr:hypothetical protein PHYBLDRAFT_161941 [Phycomyces blakesleeanus NRRL 1555(-)]OAD81329.1 hypothetical protein PHYBLDRAFT_161941 [Phycomyces blakesleeanus NRRL 1555(-)]|eukprot:XP_018299369.1 hypothetical protein PHYBLDRAFT_161941 [Phycomyces blakesleeanus NRRL 1555(-)]
MDYTTGRWSYIIKAIGDKITRKKIISLLPDYRLDHILNKTSISDNNHDLSDHLLILMRSTIKPSTTLSLMLHLYTYSFDTNLAKLIVIPRLIKLTNDDKYYSDLVPSGKFYIL